MPENQSAIAEDPFYIHEIECVVCGACQAVAPDLVGTRPGPYKFDQYFFKKQPELPGEVNRAIAAVQGCCVAAIYYRGSDPGILNRVSAMSAAPPMTSCCHGPNSTAKEGPILSSPPAGLFAGLLEYFRRH